MSTSRRVFLEVLGGASAVAAGCGGVLDDDLRGLGRDAGAPGEMGGSAGSGGSAEPGGSAGTGIDPVGTGGADNGGAGGSAGTPGTGGSAGNGTAGSAGGNGGAAGGTAGSGGASGGGGRAPDAGTRPPTVDAGRPAVEAGAVLARGDVRGGNISALAVQALRNVSGASVALGRDASGVYALSNICTHQGCGVSASSTGFSCPCHGSRFDRNGAVTNGPATRPLVHYAVDIDAAGEIIIHTATQVPATMRTAV